MSGYMSCLRPVWDSLEASFTTMPTNPSVCNLYGAAAVSVAGVGVKRKERSCKKKRKFEGRLGKRSPMRKDGQNWIAIVQIRPPPADEMARRPYQSSSSHFEAGSSKSKKKVLTNLTRKRIGIWWRTLCPPSPGTKSTCLLWSLWSARSQIPSGAG